jgi:uncharacterized lipoprotein YmbA
MKMKFWAALIIAAMLAACGGGSAPVNKAVSQVEKAIEKIEKNKNNMTEADWQALEKEVEEPLQAIAKAMEANKFSMTEQIKVAALMAKWSAVVIEAGMIQMEKETGVKQEDWAKELEKAVEELQKVMINNQ